MEERAMKNPSRWVLRDSENGIEGRLLNVGAGLTRIADGLVSVFSLGYYSAHWSFDYVCWRLKRDIKRSNK